MDVVEDLGSWGSNGGGWPPGIESRGKKFYGKPRPIVVCSTAEDASFLIVKSMKNCEVIIQAQSTVHCCSISHCRRVCNC
jgi:hypothetical protein